MDSVIGYKLADIVEELRKLNKNISKLMESKQGKDCTTCKYGNNPPFEFPCSECCYKYPSRYEEEMYHGED